MKIAIHHREGSFSDRWISYCKKKEIPFKIVNSYDNDIIEQVKECEAFMWHYHQDDYKDVLFAKQLLYSLEQAGKQVFPDSKTCWHFDDKLGQKYLLEAINAPIVPSYVFFDKKSAKKWIDSTTFPKVYKLRGGAGAANVSLLKSKKRAIRKCEIAFGKGFSQFNRIQHFKEYYQKYKEGKVNFKKLMKATGRLIIPTEFAKMKGPEKGYVYLQDFIPNNDSDIRVIVVGNKAFAIKRMVRTGDFRASGSGNIIYLNDDQIDHNVLNIAFKTSSELDVKCLAFDFVYNDAKQPLIIEISYGFVTKGYDPCPGYWSKDFKWHEEKFNPQEWMIQDLIEATR